MLKSALSLSIVGLLVASSALAVGGYSGGGGGSGYTPSKCASDTYSCGDWSDCSLDSVQTRECTLTDDCEYVVDEPPEKARSCEPVCRSDGWSCGDWSACSNGIQTRTCSLWYDCPLVEDPSPATSQSCSEEEPTAEAEPTPEPEPEPAPVTCTEDTWACSDWTDCDIYGNQQRTCSMSVDCPGVVTNSPNPGQRCDHLQCDQEALYDRVFCRLNLAPAGITRELEIEYLPEPCRPLDGEEQGECIERYQAFNECWKYEVGQPRFDCVRKSLDLDVDIDAAKVACARDAQCLDELTQKIHYMISFRFYDLEARAEDFAREGVDLETTAAFVTKVLENKVAFQAADSYQERRDLIEQMRDDWAAYIVEARSQLSR